MKHQYPDLRVSTYTYGRGCRCEGCRAAMSSARRASAKRLGSELRIGKRAEQKRRWDREHP